MDMEAKILAKLQRTYTQMADGRQKALGLSYMTAETSDLAKEMSGLFAELFADQINELIGYYQNGTDTTLKVYQDDASRTYHVCVGKRQYCGLSLRQVLAEAIASCEEF